MNILAISTILGNLFIGVINLSVVSVLLISLKLDQETIKYCLLNDEGESHYVTNNQSWSVEDVGVWSLTNNRKFKKK